jgi:hypothetical protein
MGENIMRIGEQEIIVKSFKKYGISNAADAMQDNVLFEESESSDNSNESDSSDDYFIVLYNQ